LWLQAAGYNTYYTGKLFNAQKVTNYNKPHAAGFTGSDFLLDPFTYEYMNATFQRNRDPPVSYEGQYSTDVLASKAYDFLDDAVKAGKPFMLTVAPVAPHSNVHIIDNNIHGNYSGTSAIQSPPVPAERHKHLFQNAQVPRNAAFNPDEPSTGAAWISHLAQQNATNIEYNDEWYRNRLRALQSVDEMVGEIGSRLQSHGILDDTYLIFTTDNGYHIGQHRLQPGKQCSYKEDINIPFLIRGPDVPKKHTSHSVTSHTDLAATFLQIAGAKERHDLDGDAIPLTFERMLEAEVGFGIGIADQVWGRRHRRQEHVSVEMWGIIMSEGKFGNELHHNHTYKALRVVGEGYDLRYTVWCGGERELYDLEVCCVSVLISLRVRSSRLSASPSATMEGRDESKGTVVLMIKRTNRPIPTNSQTSTPRTIPSHPPPPPPPPPPQTPQSPP
jgi:N-acetylglucosamine-6-sulfatase